MFRRFARSLPAAALVAGALAVPQSAAAADIFFATTPTNELVSFTSQAPGRILSREPIGGLAAGETVAGIDQRPATGQLYLLTTAGRLLVVDRSSGDTRRVGGGTIPLSGTSIGFDFNPVGDRIRIVSDTDINLRVNPDTANDVADTALAYAAGDAAAGVNPAIGAVAYTNAGFGPAPENTELFGIDAARDTLVRQEPPNDGRLLSVGSLGVDAVEPVQLTIAGAGARYAAFATNGTPGMRLWSINTAGAAAPAAFSPAIGVPAITAMTTVGETATETAGPRVAVGNYTTYRGIWLTRGLKFTITCTRDCSTTATLRLGGVIAGTASMETPVAGTRAPLIKLNAAGRAIALRKTRIAASLTFVATDLGGIKRTQVAEFTSLPGINTGS